MPVLQAEGSRASVAQGEMIYWNDAQAHSGKQEGGKGNDRLERIKPGMKKTGWKDSLVLKSTCCSVERTRIQVPSPTSGGSQMPVTPTPKDLMLFSHLLWPCKGTTDTQTHTNGATKQNGSWYTIVHPFPTSSVFQTPAFPGLAICQLDTS